MTLSDEEQKALHKDHDSLNSTPGVSPGLTLGLPEEVGDLVFEADDLDATIELAARIPAACHGGAIEIRPVATNW